MEIKFAQGFYAWKDFNEQVQKLIIQNGFKSIGEIGGGANPLLSLDFIEKQNLTYHVMDVSMNELAKAGRGYETITLDLEKPILRPGGQAYLFFACAISLPSFINLIIPGSVSEKILLTLQPFRRNEKHGKFKAYYKWCFGPTPKNIYRFKKMNFTVLSYTGYFGHSYYQRICPLNFFEKIKTKLLLKHPNSYLCSYAQVLLKK